MRSVNRGRRQDQRKEDNKKKMFPRTHSWLVVFDSRLNRFRGDRDETAFARVPKQNLEIVTISRGVGRLSVSLSLSFEPRYLEILKQVGKVCVHVCAHSARGTCIRHVYTAGACNVRANHDKCVYHDARDRISSKPSRASGNRRRRRSVLLSHTATAYREFLF